MKISEILVKFVADRSLEAESNPLWVREVKNNALLQIALKDPKFSSIRGF